MRPCDSRPRRESELARAALTQPASAVQGVVECPLHFARFDVRTGQLLHGPVAENVSVYEVRVDGDLVYVQR